MKTVQEDDTNVKLLIESLKQLGWSVRREKLARGPAFRIKSGFCKVFGQKVVFLDRQLPVLQQQTLLEDFIAELTPANALAASQEPSKSLSGEPVLQIA